MRRVALAALAAMLLAGCSDLRRDLAACEMEAIRDIPSGDSLRWNGFLFACMRSKGYSFQENPTSCTGSDLRPINLNCWSRRWPWQ